MIIFVSKATSMKIISNILLFSLLVLFCSGSCSDDKDETKPQTDNRINLTGRWTAEGYECPRGTTHTEIIDIVHDLKTEEVKATKFTGDACVTAGNITFTGKYNGNANTSGNTIIIILRTGLPNNPNSGQIIGSIRVESNSLMKTISGEKIIFTRENVFADLPNCPCKYKDKQEGETEKEGKWGKDDKIDVTFGVFHYGAVSEMRWFPNKTNAPGQQCTYDKEGNLITSGIAAGSPDLVSPGGFFGDISAGIPATHNDYDVVTWKSIDCEQYLKKWAANNGNKCPSKPVNDILHQAILPKVKGMTCEQITSFLQAIDNPLSKTPKEIVDFFHNPSDKVPANLRNELIKVATNCLFAGLRKEYDAVQKVIANIP